MADIAASEGKPRQEVKGKNERRGVTAIKMGDVAAVGRGESMSSEEGLC